MNNFLMLDNNKIASARQVYAVACKFANIQAKTPSERYGLKKVLQQKMATNILEMSHIFHIGIGIILHKKQVYMEEF